MAGRIEQRRGLDMSYLTRQSGGLQIVILNQEPQLRATSAAALEG